MSSRGLLVTAAALAVAVASAARAQTVAAPNPDQLERGRYLVQQVGMCVDCHGSSLHGSKLDFLAPGLPAAHAAPRIAGLPKMKFAEAVTYFETGKLPGGAFSRPPMPQYRLHHDDAVAITRYLKSLQ
jgi:mono/diheme cytochrome c family protein